MCSFKQSPKTIKQKSLMLAPLPLRRRRLRINTNDTSNDIEATDEEDEINSGGEIDTDSISNSDSLSSPSSSNLNEFGQMFQLEIPSIGMPRFDERQQSRIDSSMLRMRMGVPDANRLAVPDVIEMLKNLAACKEKQHKWEQSLSKLTEVANFDLNKKQLMEIIDYVDSNKSTTKEKAIYLYEQLGHKCHQCRNYIGAAKAFERAANLRLDVSDQSTTPQSPTNLPPTPKSNVKRETALSTINYLESAIRNYDIIHKYKHAGSLHYRCSKILKMIDASHEEVEQHHIKALKYFTKPDHELKQRKRIDGLKVSCYSSCSTWAQMKQMTHNQKSNFTTTLTTTTNMIKFHRSGEEEIEEECSNDSSFSTPPPPPTSSSSGSSTTTTLQPPPLPEPSQSPQHYCHRKTPILEDHLDKDLDKFFNEDDEDEEAIFQNCFYDPTSTTTMINDQNFDDDQSFALISNSPPTLINGKPKLVQKSQKNNHYHHQMSPSNQFQHNERRFSESTMQASRSSHQKHRTTNSSKSSAASSSMSSSSFMYKQKKSSYLSSLSNEQKNSNQNNNIKNSNYNFGRNLECGVTSKISSRCVEDRIESARKLVKKLNKLCPFYEVRNRGQDAGRVYCRICDRYLGAVSSTLKNHVNTQEHRQAYEDSHQPQQQIIYPPLQTPLAQPSLPPPIVSQLKPMNPNLNDNSTSIQPVTYSNIQQTPILQQQQMKSYQEMSSPFAMHQDSIMMRSASIMPPPPQPPSQQYNDISSQTKILSDSMYHHRAINDVQMMNNNNDDGQLQDIQSTLYSSIMMSNDSTMEHTQTTPSQQQSSIDNNSLKMPMISYQ